MELREYWNIIRRHWWLPAAITVVALIASTVVGLRGATAYKTDMRLAVSTIPTPDANGVLYYDPTYYSNLDSEYLADDMSEFMTSRAFADEVHRELASNSSPYDVDIATIVDATRAKKTHRFIDITLTTATFDEGQAIAGSISRILSDPNHISQYLTALTAYHAQLEIVTPPVTDRANTLLGLISEIALRTVIGLLVGIGLAFLIDYLDPSVRTREEAERVLQMPVLAEIPRAPWSARNCRLTFAESVAALRERWWLLLVAFVVAALAAYAYIKMPWVEARWRSSVLMQATGRLDYGNFRLEKELRPLAEQVMQLDIMREVDQDLHTDLPPETMLEHTKAEPVVDSDQIRIDVEDSDATRAEQISLAIADVYTQQHNAAEQGKLREERVILSTLDRPNQAALIWPQTRLVVPAAGLLGLLVAGLVVLGMLYFDNAIRSPADVQRYLELPVLGSVPRFRRLAAGRQSPTEPQPRSPKEMVEELPTGAARTRS